MATSRALLHPGNESPEQRFARLRVETLEALARSWANITESTELRVRLNADRAMRVLRPQARERGKSAFTWLSLEEFRGLSREQKETYFRRLADDLDLEKRNRGQLLDRIWSRRAPGRT